MWNYVQMDDGEWYDIDCTWDDKVTIIKIAKLHKKVAYSLYLIAGMQLLSLYFVH